MSLFPYVYVIIVWFILLFFELFDKDESRSTLGSVLKPIVLFILYSYEYLLSLTAKNNSLSVFFISFTTL